MLIIAEVLLESYEASLVTALLMTMIKNRAINKMTIEPVIARGMIFLFGQLFLMPLTKLIIEIIKHGIKIAKTTQMIAITTTHRRIPTKKIPMNAMLLFTPFYVLTKYYYICNRLIVLTI